MGLIFVLMLVSVALILIGLVIRHENKWDDWEIPVFIGIVVAVFASICLGIAVHELSYKDLNTELYRQKYDALTMQLDENYYNRITFDGRQTLINDIVSYNAAVTKGRRKHDSIWIGVFYSEDWDSLPLINLKE